jgi:uncharacterized membrane protein
MKRQTHAGKAYALPVLFVAGGLVLAIVVAYSSIRHLVEPNTQSWTAWTTTGLTALGALALLLCLTGGALAWRVHRARRDRVLTFLDAGERGRVLDAVSRFEAATSGEIRVHLAQNSEGDPVRAAVLAFERLGMTRTRERNGVLILVSVRDHRVAVIGDAGIHERVPEGFWAEVVRAIELRFSEGRFADGLVEGIAMAGTKLAEHFPHRAGDVNELPDSISEDAH